MLSIRSNTAFNNLNFATKYCAKIIQTIKVEFCTLLFRDITDICFLALIILALPVSVCCPFLL